MIRKMAVTYGLGGAFFDPINGEVAIIPRYRALGLICPDVPFSYTDSQGQYDFLRDADWRGSTADSFGADYQSNNFTGLQIDYVAGFQPSVWANNVGPDDTIVIPSNIKFAHCIRNPVWAQTFGLGYAKYVAQDSTLTKIAETDVQAMHPGDFGYGQDLIVAEVKSLIGA
jgi:hypothetical protein